jgi:hypothetical protein
LSLRGGRDSGSRKAARLQRLQHDKGITELAAFEILAPVLGKASIVPGNDARFAAMLHYASVITGAGVAASTAAAGHKDLRYEPKGRREPQGPVVRTSRASRG